MPKIPARIRAGDRETPQKPEATPGHTSQCTHSRINSQGNLKIHPKPGETHTRLQRCGTRAKPTLLSVLLGLCSGSHVPTLPRVQPGTSARATGPPLAVPAGTRSSHPRFLGDCCQVRNSEAEFIILADKWRCSSPELEPGCVPARCWAGPPRAASASRSPRGGQCPGLLALASLPGRQHVFWGYFCPLERRRRGMRRKHREHGAAQMAPGWRAALPWLL